MAIALLVAVVLVEPMPKPARKTSLSYEPEPDQARPGLHRPTVFHDGKDSIVP
jgi:hypothetical protein